MGNKLKKIKTKLELRQIYFDKLKNKNGFKRPGSMNRHKQGVGNPGMTTRKR